MVMVMVMGGDGANDGRDEVNRSSISSNTYGHILHQWRRILAPLV